MSAADPLLVETLTRMLEEHCTPEVGDRAEQGEWPQALWDTLEAAGLPLAWVPETRGGAGASLADGFRIVRVAARYAAPVPLAETLLAGWTLSQAGVDAPPGPLCAAPTRTDDAPALNSRDRLSGVLREVPFASDAKALVLVARRGDGVAMAMLRLDAGRHRDRVKRSSSLTGEPQDDVSLDDLIPDVITNMPAEFDLAQRRVGATLRAQQIAGALEAVLEQSLRYAGDRSQFGRPIAKFQGGTAQPGGARWRGGSGRRGGGCRGLGHRTVRLQRRSRLSRGGGGQDPGEGGGRQRRCNRPPGSRHDRLHPRVQPAATHSPPVVVARRLRTRSRVGGRARPTGGSGGGGQALGGSECRLGVLTA